MKLRTQILLGYWYLVALVVISAGAATLGFQTLGSNLGTVLDENFESVRSSMSMLEALERQDSAVLAALLGEEGARRRLQDSEQAFADAISRARAKVTIEGEEPLLDEIERRYAEFQQERDRLLADPPTRPLQEYDNSTFPLFVLVKEEVYGLLDLNHRAMIESDQRAQAAARRRAIGHGFLVLVALLSLVFLSQALGREVLDRLADMSVVAAAIARGDQRRRAAVVKDDELGAVARQLNAVLDRLAEQETAAAGQNSQLRQLVLGLVDELPEPAAIVSLSGDLLASSMSPSLNLLVETATRQLSDRTTAPSSGWLHVEIEGRQLGFRRIHTNGVRPVAWLARLETE